MGQVVINVVISLVVTSILLCAYEVKMQQRFLDAYEKLLRISRGIRETDVNKTCPESGHPTESWG